MSRKILLAIPILFILLLLGSTVPLMESSDGIIIFANRIIFTNTKATGILDNDTFTFYFSGEVSCRTPWEEENLYVQLIVESPFENSEIETFVFSRRVNVRNFEITLKAPLDTPREEYYMSVHGVCGTDPSNLNQTIDPASAILVIPQIFSWDIKCQKSVEITAGRSTEVPFNISNLGNGLDKIRLKITNLDEFKEMGWDLQLSPDIVHMPENSSRQIPMFIDIPDDQRPGSYKMIIKYNSTIEDHFGMYQEDGKLTFMIEVLNDYKDEVLKGLKITAPVILIYLVILVAIDLVRRHKK